MIAAPSHRRAVTPHEFPQAIELRRRTRRHRLVREVMHDVGRQRRRRFVAARAVLLQALHDDPVELAADQRAELSRLDARAAPRPTQASSLFMR